MATATIKSTYSLDIETVRQLEELALNWNLSKSAALRKAIGEAAHKVLPKISRELEALDKLQSSLALDAKQASAWENEARSERRAATGRSRS